MGPTTSHLREEGRSLELRVGEGGAGRLVPGLLGLREEARVRTLGSQWKTSMGSSFSEGPKSPHLLHPLQEPLSLVLRLQVKLPLGLTQSLAKTLHVIPLLAQLPQLLKEQVWA